MPGPEFSHGPFTFEPGARYEVIFDVPDEFRYQTIEAVFLRQDVTDVIFEWPAPGPIRRTISIDYDLLRAYRKV